MLLADAQPTADTIRGEGDGERNRIFADAFNRDPDFFSFYRAMQAYEAGLRGDTRMLLKPDSDFFRYFVDPSGRRGRAERSAGTPPRRNATRRHGRRAAGGRPALAPAAAMRPKRHVRFHRRHRSGACHRRTDLRRLSRGGKAAGGERPGNAGRVAAHRRRGIGGARCCDRVAGARLVGLSRDSTQRSPVHKLAMVPIPPQSGA